jgi:asparagine synthase (glutamine-hydrolysing)
MGTVPIYYRVSQEEVLFGTSIDATVPESSLKAGSNRIDGQAIYDYVYFHMVPSPGVILEGVGKLRAAERCVLQPGKVISKDRHWIPVFREASNDSAGELQRELRETLREAVASSIPESGITGAFLSGGLDSSTVAGMLAELQGQSAKAVSIGFEAEGYDEMPYARLAAAHFDIKLIEHYVTPTDVVDALPKVAAAFDEPFGNSSALPAYFCAKVAKEAGIDTLLAGDGGDELFAGNERYAPHRALQSFRALPATLRNVIHALMNALPGTLPLAAKAQSFSKQAALCTPDRLQYYNFLHQIEAATVFENEFLAAVDSDAPLSAWRGTYMQAGEDCSELNRMLFLDWQYTLADNDLRKVGQACELAGVAVRYPMLVDALIDLSLRIPSDMKLKGGELRAFYKAALSGWLPQATIDKSKHGFGLPFGVWMRQHMPLAELAYDSISDLGRRGIFQAAFLEHAVAMHRQGHAAYFGELVWLLTVLELWLTSHETWHLITPCPP